MKLEQTMQVARRAKTVVSEELGDEVVLYDSEGNAIHVLNATAKLIWELCDGEHSLEDMERAIRASFSGLERRDVAKDILQVIAVFREKALLEELG